MSRTVIASVFLTIGLWVAGADAQGVATHGTLPGAFWERFDAPWPGGHSPDHLFRIDGSWIGTGGNLFQPANSAVLPDAPHGGGALRLLVPGGQTAPPFRAAEIASVVGQPGTNMPGLGYGYYEVSLQVAATPGVCDSFFWIEAPNYGPREWDIEFLTGEGWTGSTDRGVVHVTLHPSNRTLVVPLAFNPARAPHRYGFLWTPNRIIFTADGKQIGQFDGDELVDPAGGGFVMANQWTGNADWGGGPPREDAASLYHWIRFEAGATSIPDW